MPYVLFGNVFIVISVQKSVSNLKCYMQDMKILSLSLLFNVKYLIASGTSLLIP